MSGAERHERAVRQSLRWAAEAALAGDFRLALGWLEVVHTIDGDLPPGWEAKRQRWLVEAGRAAAEDAGENVGGDPGESGEDAAPGSARSVVIPDANQ
jgi:hypothetical protein